MSEAFLENFLQLKGLEEFLINDNETITVSPQTSSLLLMRGLLQDKNEN